MCEKKDSVYFSRFLKIALQAKHFKTSTHDFPHGGHYHMPWACGLHQGVAGREGENKVCRPSSFING